MLDLFHPPTITPRPTRIVLRLDGVSTVRVCAPRKVERLRPRDMSPRAERRRALCAAWARAKRASDPAWRDARNRRSRERYYAKRAALQGV